jgi:hypothetical protein
MYGDKDAEPMKDVEMTSPSSAPQDKEAARRMEERRHWQWKEAQAPRAPTALDHMSMQELKALYTATFGSQVPRMSDKSELIRALHAGPGKTADADADAGAGAVASTRSENTVVTSDSASTVPFELPSDIETAVNFVVDAEQAATCVGFNQVGNLHSSQCLLDKRSFTWSQPSTTETPAQARPVHVYLVGNSPACAPMKGFLRLLPLSNREALADTIRSREVLDGVELKGLIDGVVRAASDLRGAG